MSIMRPAIVLVRWCDVHHASASVNVMDHGAIGPVLDLYLDLGPQ